jgi:hypothetical protein
VGFISEESAREVAKSQTPKTTATSRQLSTNGSSILIRLSSKYTPPLLLDVSHQNQLPPLLLFVSAQGQAAFNLMGSRRRQGRSKKISFYCQFRQIFISPQQNSAPNPFLPALRARHSQAPSSLLSLISGSEINEQCGISFVTN